MVFTIDIELTAKITHCLITGAKGQQVVGEETTAPDQLSTLLACIKAGARELDCSIRDLLKNTITINLKVPELVTGALARQSGTQVGLIVTQGYEINIYDAGNNHHPVLAAMLAQGSVVGIEEETTAQGQQISPPRAADAQEKVNYLLNLGCGTIAICLKRASLNPANEVRLREFAYADYPRHYLGAVPILISSDFSVERDDAIRTNICLLNAYTWFTLDQFLRRVENSLRQNGYSHSLKITQTDGEVVPITRVTPLKTCGPKQLAGLNQFIGAAEIWSPKL